jgi:hypothetical protein
MGVGVSVKQRITNHCFRPIRLQQSPTTTGTICKYPTKYTPKVLENEMLFE